MSRPSILGERETATILAALRHWQNSPSETVDIHLLDIARNGDRFDALSDDEIDDLCETLNFGEAS